MKNNVFDLSVFVTDKCNRGCKHCIACATNKGTKFIKEHWIRKLIKEAKALDYKVTGVVTGLGEPLMHPQVVKLVESFFGLKVCVGVGFLTSGFLAKDEEEKQLFQQLVNSQYRQNIDFQLSFNLYNPTFAERVEQTLGVLFSRKERLNFQVNVVGDLQNYFETFYELYGILNCVGVKNGLDINMLGFGCDQMLPGHVIPNILSPRYSKEKHSQLLFDIFNMACVFGASGKKQEDKYFRINSGVISQLGFAKNLPAECFDIESKFLCHDVLRAKKDEKHLIMGTDGRMFASCNCLLGNLSIGTWKTPLSKLILRKKLLQKHLLRLIITDKSLKWGRWPCEECAEFAKKNFSFD